MKVNEIKKVAVVGAGNMGEGIAQNFAEAGIQVTLMARHSETLAKCLERIKADLMLFQEFKLLHEDPNIILARVKAVQVQNLPDIAKEFDFVMETIPEILEEKKKLLAILDSCRTEAIIGSNTSSFTITNITEDMKTPERVVGMHYFNPAHIMPLVEIHRGKKTRDDVVETAKALMAKTGKKTALVMKEVPGFIVNRIQGAIYREISDILEQGVTTPEDLDTAMKASLGFRYSCIGPMEAEDMIGLDTSAKVSARVYRTLSSRTEPNSLLLEKVKRGELGINTGKGWYDYGKKTRSEVMEEKNRKLLRQLAATKND
jgi:3-hydroxybutyryl-CoA dehydrogenase